MRLRHLITPVTLLAAAASARASANATPDEATAMVRKGVAFMRANGAEKGCAEISNKTGQFKDRNLYLVVYSLDGVVRAHGTNEQTIDITSQSAAKPPGCLMRGSGP